MSNIDTILDQLRQVNHLLPAAPHYHRNVIAHLLAYNLIRLLMAQATVLVCVLPRQISYKHTLELWLTWSRQITLSEYNADIDVLFVLIAQQQVGKRLGRIEPRAVKRRPKAYPMLMKPRALARVDVRENGHPKSLSKCHSTLRPVIF